MPKIVTWLELKKKKMSHLSSTAAAQNLALTSGISAADSQDSWSLFQRWKREVEGSLHSGTFYKL